MIFQKQGLFQCPLKWGGLVCQTREKCYDPQE